MISREDLIVQSIQSFVIDELRGRGYTQQRVEILDGFDATLFEEKYGETGLDKTYVAVAFQFDNGGSQAELGSSLKSYLHTIDFLTLGHTSTWGRNVAHVIKAVLNVDRGALALRDYNVAIDPRPIIDWLPIEEISTEREHSYDPRPWQQFAWSTRLRVWDEVVAIDAA
jgi:hypothetical protein